MRFTPSDRDFLKVLDLSKPKFNATRMLLKNKKYHKAALSAAEVIFSKPIKHNLSEKDIPLIARTLNRHHPDLVRQLKQTVTSDAKRALSIQSRGLLSYRAGRLFALTQDRKWLDLAGEQFRLIAQQGPELSEASMPALFPWHPGKGAVIGYHFNYLAIELCDALPFVRAHLSPAAALALLKVMWTLADYSYRGAADDVLFNYPMGYIVAACSIACYFPDFKASPTWLTWACGRLERDCTGAPTITKDGYFREGFSYQEVNAKHALRCARAMRGAGLKGQQKFFQAVENAFEFTAKISKVDGELPLVGDTGPGTSQYQYRWHLASAFFKRPDFKAIAPRPVAPSILEVLHWEMGVRGFAWWKKQKCPSMALRTQGPADLSDSGFQVLGTGTGTKTHYGLLTYGLSHNHAHYDVGSIDITGYGRPLVTDPGKATYKHPQYLVDVSERVHNLPCLIRRQPFGPRIDNVKYAETLFVQHRKRYQAVGMEHRLYENHVVRRTLVCVPLAGTGGQPGKDVYWVVIDQVERTEKWPKGATVPLELIETYFHMNAPETELGLDEDSFTCWSRYRPGSTIRRFKAEDTDRKGPFERVNLGRYFKAMSMTDSDANMQISGVFPDRRDTALELRPISSTTTEYRGRVKRPAASFMFRGRLPFRAAYVLVPFRGVRKSPFAVVTGCWESSNALYLKIAFKGKEHAFEIERLNSASPQIKIR